ncbi:MAG: hypothetical protein J5J06_14975 [Phycisphaerae bacterium]|nr:hypothetical protein [Phycisphaerae bacterium]
MTGVLEWLFGLEQIQLARDAPLLLKWQSPVQPWMVLCFACLVIPAVLLIYRRESCTPGRRFILGLIRFVVIVWVALLLCQPAIVLQRNRSEPAYTVLLVDSSSSMGMQEAYMDPELEERAGRGAALPPEESPADYSRLDLARRAMLAGDAEPIRVLLQHNAVQLSSFDSDVRPLAAVAKEQNATKLVASLESLSATGTTTDLSGALHAALEGSGGRRIAAVVLASDGQRTETAGLADVLELARGREIPIFPVRIGSPAPRFDLEVNAFRSESVVYLNDLATVEGRIEARGLTEPLAVDVNLFDEDTDTKLDSRAVTIDPQAGLTRVEFVVRPQRSGKHRYRIEVPPPAQDLVAGNNSAVVDVFARDERLRILFVDAYPRFEYRYLKNALLREKSMELSVLLLDADRDFVQEGSERIRRFPDSPEELHQYNVVLFGDVDPRAGWLSAAQMDMLLDYVGHVGGGFGLIAGERSAPQRFVGTPLERLIPVQVDPRSDIGVISASGFMPVLSSEGREHRIFRAIPSSRSESISAALLDPQKLPPLYWFLRTGGVKPGAVALAYHPTQRTLAASGVGDDRMPIVVVGRYGAGKLFFQATDETWRWRRHTGELLHDGYWVQVVRFLAPSGPRAEERQLTLRTDRREYEFGAPVRIEAEVRDGALSARLGDSFSVSVKREQESELSPVDRSKNSEEETRAAMEARPDLRRLGPLSTRFEGTFIPRRPGLYVLEPGVSGTADSDDGRLPWTFHVARPERELRHPEADHRTLEEIAERTGGRVLALDELAAGFADIRDGSVNIPDDITEPLWDSRLALGVFVLLIGMEWSLRKWFGLL